MLGGSKCTTFDLNNEAYTINALLRFIPQIRGKVLDPCAVDLKLVNQLMRDETIRPFADDITLAHGDRCHDARQKEYWAHWGHSLNWIVTNPGYSRTTDTNALIMGAWKHVQDGIAVLMKLSYLHDNRCEELEPIKPYLSNLILFNHSPKKEKDTNVWFVWEKNHRGTVNVHHDRGGKR